MNIALLRLLMLSRDWILYTFGLVIKQAKHRHIDHLLSEQQKGGKVLEGMKWLLKGICWKKKER